MGFPGLPWGSAESCVRGVDRNDGRTYHHLGFVVGAQAKRHKTWLQGWEPAAVPKGPLSDFFWYVTQESLLWSGGLVAGQGLCHGVIQLRPVWSATQWNFIPRWDRTGCLDHWPGPV
jgi:hypothetical protein